MRSVFPSFLFALGLVLSAFGLSSDDFKDPSTIRVYSFTSFTSAANFQTSYSTISLMGSDPYFSFCTQPFGLAFNSSGSITVPSQSLVSLTNSSFDIKFPIRSQPTNSNSNVYLSPYLFPRISNLFRSVVNLYSSGYRGPGVSVVFSSSSQTAVNFNFPLIVSDILSSTNTVFRQIVIGHLSSIQQSIANIEVNVSGLQSSIDSGNAVLGSIQSSVDSGNSMLGAISNSSFSALSSLSSIASNSSFNASLQGFVNAAIVDFPAFLDELVDMGETDRQNADIWLQYYGGLSNPTSRAVFASQVSRYLGDKSMADTFLSVLCDTATRLRGPGSYFNESVVDALIGDYPVVANNIRGSKSVDVRTSIKSQLQAWREDAKLQLQDWKSDLKQDLQDWKSSDERGILNIRDDIRNNFSYRDPRPGSTNNLPFTSFVTNYVTRVITNVVRQSANDIASNVVDQAERTRNFFDDKLFDPNSDGVNVRIKWPLRYESTSEVNVHDQALDDILGNLHSYTTTMSNLLEGALLEFKNNLTATNSVDWQPWFEKWGEYADVVTNFYVQFNGSGPVADLADRFLSQGFDSQLYGELPWFSRVEVLLAMIAGVSTNSIDVADVSEELSGLVDEFSDLGTNVVSSSESFVGLFDYVRRTADRFKSVFGDRSAPVTDSGIVLLSAGSWIGNEPLVLKVNPTVQNVLRLFFRCFWLLSALVVVWLVVSWSWQKVVAILRWLWSMFEL